MPPRSAQQEGAASSSAPDQSTGKYYVTSAGCPYAVGGDMAFIQVAMHGHVIDLVDSEATRLLNLNAIRAATDDEVAADTVRRQVEADINAANAAGPADNPYGGRLAGVSLEEHAAEQIKLAHKAAS